MTRVLHNTGIERLRVVENRVGLHKMTNHILTFHRFSSLFSLAIDRTSEEKS